MIKNGITVNEEKFKELEEVNSIANANIHYKSDTELYNQIEQWEDALTVGQGEGDCEDYALAKRHMLMRRGWDPDILRLACCWVETGEYHAVLVVHLDGVDWVLDNRFSNVVHWMDTGYKWHKILMPDIAKWKEIEN